MPPKRKNSQKSPLTEEDFPAMAKRTRGSGNLRRTPRLSDLESTQITAPPSVTPDILPLGQSSSQPLASSQQPLGSQQLPGLSSEQLSTADQTSMSNERFSGNTHRGPQLVCSSHAIAILADSIDFDDYKTQLYYFWGHIFLHVRNLKTKERREIFEATLPEFVQGEEVRSKLETEFDACYRRFQKQFIKAVEVYGHRWLKSPACQKFREIELHARKQKRPKQVPIPLPPQTGQDLLRFQEWTGLEWDYNCAIDFWSFCLPAFKTCDVPAKHIGWFLAEDDLAYKELSGVALELIRQFAVFEMRSPGGYSLEAHTHALRTVMPVILKDNQVNLYELPQKLGISVVTLPDIPSMPNYDLAPWAPENMQYVDEFDETKTDLDVSTSHLSHGVLDQQDDELFNERLKEVDTNIQRIDEGLPPADELTAREAEVAVQFVKEVESDINSMFTETLRVSLEGDDDYINSDYQPPIEDLAIPQLHAPLILDGPRMTKRAEMYASGNIWARQVMAQADRAIEIRRLKALLVAAQHAIALLELEEKRYQQQIAELQEVNKYLSEAWKQVQERIQQNKLVQEKRDRLSEETDSLQQSRVAQDGSGTGSSFFGFQGLRFSNRVASSPTPGQSSAFSATGNNPGNMQSSFQGAQPLGPASNPILNTSFKSHQAQTKVQAQAPSQSTQYQGHHGKAQVSSRSSPQHQAAHPIQNSQQTRTQAALTSNTRAVQLPRESRPMPARPAVLGTSPGAGFLSQLGHHGRAGSPGGKLASSFPSFGSFNSRNAARSTGAKANSGTSSLTTHDMSRPHTSHSTQRLPSDSPSPFPLQKSHPSSGEGTDHGPTTPSHLDNGQGLEEGHPVLDQESDFLDDASLLQATVSAEQQLTQSQEEDT